MESTQKNRKIDLSEQNVDYSRINVNSTALLNICKQASNEIQNRGWGKLLGYYDGNTKRLVIEESYGLLLPKTNEKMKHEDKMDEIIKKNMNDFSFQYRQVGFYIFCEDNDIFTYPILNYIINNENFGIAKTFLHFSTQKAKLGKNPFVFYEISSKFNELLSLKKLETNKSYYEIDEALIANFNIKNESIFSEIEFEIQKSEVFQKFVHRNPELFQRVVEGDRKEGGKLSENINKNLNESIHKHAVILQQYFLNKKAQKKASIVNLFGSYERVKKTLEEKSEVADEVYQKMKNIEIKLN